MELLRRGDSAAQRVGRIAARSSSSTTPFYHPILPLLWDKRLARQAMPDVHVAAASRADPEDAASSRFAGRSPITKSCSARSRAGCGPRKARSRKAIIPAIAAAGIEWIATDEEILSHSTDGWVSRDSQGFLRHPEMLYRPWRVEEKGQVAADRLSRPCDERSDRFQLSADGAGARGRRFRWASSRRSAGRPRPTPGNRPTLVSIILDGENCWEYYPNSGVDFLRERLSPRRQASQDQAHSASAIISTSIPATDKIGHLFAGSWISHNFGIWIGHPECNRAWDLVV